MDLLSIARKFWRFKLLTLPVVLLTLCGAVYVVAIKEPVYEATSSYILINPPEPPTPEDIAQNPALGQIDADNPYTRFSDQSVIVELLAGTLSSDSARRALVSAGADPRYKVAPKSEFGFSTPFVGITARGSSPEAAVRSAAVVGKAVTRELDRLQQAEGTDSQYRIQAHQVDAPGGAKLRASGKLRMLVGVLAFGAVLLFVVVSVADGLTNLRRERIERAAHSPLAGNDEPWSGSDGRAGGLSLLDRKDGSEFDGKPAGRDQLISLFPGPDPAAPSGGAPARHRSSRQK